MFSRTRSGRFIAHVDDHNHRAGTVDRSRRWTSTKARLDDDPCARLVCACCKGDSRFFGGTSSELHQLRPMALTSCMSTVPGQHHGKNKCWTKRPCDRARSRSALAARPLPLETFHQAHACHPRSKTYSRFARQLPCRPGPSRVTGRRARLHGAKRTPGIRP